MQYLQREYPYTFDWRNNVVSELELAELDLNLQNRMKRDGFKVKGVAHQHNKYVIKNPGDAYAQAPMIDKEYDDWS